jgi:hypothetical protein
MSVERSRRCIQGNNGNPGEDPPHPLAPGHQTEQEGHARNGNQGRQRLFAHTLAHALSQKIRLALHNRFRARSDRRDRFRQAGDFRAQLGDLCVNLGAGVRFGFTPPTMARVRILMRT